MEELSDTQKSAIALEENMPLLPSGITIHESGGQTVFESEGRRVCYLEKRLIYQCDLGDCITVEGVGSKLRAAVEDFNTKSGTALVFGTEN